MSGGPSHGLIKCPSRQLFHKFVSSFFRLSYVTCVDAEQANKGIRMSEGVDLTRWMSSDRRCGVYGGGHAPPAAFAGKR